MSDAVSVLRGLNLDSVFRRVDAHTVEAFAAASSAVMFILTGEVKDSLE